MHLASPPIKQEFLQFNSTQTEISWPQGVLPSIMWPSKHVSTSHSHLLRLLLLALWSPHPLFIQRRTNQIRRFISQQHLLSTKWHRLCTNTITYPHQLHQLGSSNITTPGHLVMETVMRILDSKEHRVNSGRTSRKNLVVETQKRNTPGRSSRCFQP